MSASNDFDENASKRNATAPYTPHHPVPNIQDYREHKNERKNDVQLDAPEEDIQNDPQQGIIGSLKTRLHLQEPSSGPSSSQGEVYHSQNRNVERPYDNGNGMDGEEATPQGEHDTNGSTSPRKGEKSEDTTQSAATELNPRQKRKNMKHMKRDDAGREGTSFRSNAFLKRPS